jgi:hypothetical protein
MNTYGRVYMSTAGRGIVFGTAQTCTPTAIIPYVQVNGGAWIQTGTTTLAAGGSIVLRSKPGSANKCEWRGPSEFKATGSRVKLKNVQTLNAGSYTATYTNSTGCKSSYQFKISISTDTGAVSSK